MGIVAKSRTFRSPCMAMAQTVCSMYRHEPAPTGLLRVRGILVKSRTMRALCMDVSPNHMLTCSQGKQDW